MASTKKPKITQSDIKRVAILFSGGPAPAANAVISTCGASFLKAGIEAIGVLNGYSHLLEYGPDHPLEEGRDYIQLNSKVLRRARASQGILIGTARDNPGALVSQAAHMEDPERVAPLRKVYDALRSIGVDAVVSIGGDDTLKTANKLKVFQDSLPEDMRRMPVVHLPKTIDNDYRGIDFTFGYFTAVEFLASEIRNLLYDAEASRAYFLAETMGRSAGWLAYGAAIAGEASHVLSIEDIEGEFAAEETTTDPETGEEVTRTVMNVERVVDHLVDMMLVREEEGKPFGVIVLAEALAEALSSDHLQGVKRDAHGHIAIADVDLGRKFAGWISEAYKAKTGRKRKITGLQLGYESRCAKPHAFDVMLGGQLGVGAYRAIVEQGLSGVMVSVAGQLDLQYVPFTELIDPETLVTVVRKLEIDSDFHQLARFLETNVNK